MADPAPLLRADGAEGHRVSFFELFFDLVYVFSVTQISHGLLEHLDLLGAGQALILLLAVWWAWVYTTWATNWINPDNRACRLVLIGVMGAGFVMATALPEAFGDRGLVFALSYSAIQVGRSLFVLWAVRHDPVRAWNFRRIVVWNAAASAIWIVGGLADPSIRAPIWIGALVVDYLAPAARFWVPGFGSSRTSDWTVTGSYIAERFKLFVILALGESILVTGITFAGLEVTLPVAAAFALAFVGTVAFWWLYFDRSARVGEERMERSHNPGVVARLAYTYFHLPMVAGIIVTAVADELVIAHPEGHAEPAAIAAILGGPILFVVGHGMYTWAIGSGVSLAHAVAVVALLVLAPIAPALPPLLLAGLATLTVIGVAVAGTFGGPVLAEEADVVIEAT